MHYSQSIERRLLVALTFLVVLVGAVLVLAFPRPAAADCPITGCGGGGGGVDETFTHTLVVTRPSSGTISSTTPGISCPAGSGGTCSVSQSQTVSCGELPCDEPSSGWDSYTLSATGGPSGFAAAWSGSCSGSSCSVTLDTDRSVSLTWVDVTNPSVSVSPSGKVGPTMHASATASDNAGVSQVVFLVDGLVKASDTFAPYGAAIDMSGYTQGSMHTLTARAVDTSGRATDASVSVTVDKQVSLTVGTVDPYTTATFVPVSFSTDSDASVQCALNGGSFSSCTDSFSPPLPDDGSYTYTLRATDDAGNTASVTRSFVVDRTAPDASFSDGPSEGAIVGAGPITFQFDYSDATPVGAMCALDSVGFTACGDPHSETLSGLAPGSSHTFRVRVEDAAGNTTDLARHFSVAPAPPVVVTSGQGTGGGTATSGAGGGSQGTAPVQPRLTKAKLSRSFKLKGKNTMIRRLVLTGLPGGAKVTLLCKGHGCPFRSKSFKAKHGRAVLTKAFRHKLLGKGARVTIYVAAPGLPKRMFTLSMRAHRKPRLKTA